MYVCMYVLHLLGGGDVRGEGVRGSLVKKNEMCITG